MQRFTKKVSNGGRPDRRDSGIADRGSQCQVLYYECFRFYLSWQGMPVIPNIKCQYSSLTPKPLLYKAILTLTFLKNCDEVSSV